MYLLRKKGAGWGGGGDGLDSSSLSKMLFLVLTCCEIRSTVELHRENMPHLLTCECVE